MKATRATTKLVGDFESELDKSTQKKTKKENKKTGSNTLKKVTIGSAILLTLAAATYAIFRRTGQLDFEDFARARSSM